MKNVHKINSTFDYKLIYIFRINDKEHKGCLKIGDATIHTNKSYKDLSPSCHELNYAAKKRIDEYTSTAGIVYELLYTEIAIYEKDSYLKAFRDHKVHDVLKRSGIKSKYFDTNKKQNEWFITDLETAKNAIKAVKERKTALSNVQISENSNPIIFRPEQKEAIKKTLECFKKNTKMLWNAKMRFGKTLSALQVIKEKKFKRTIIITHRPVVSEGWYEDFDKIFYDSPDYHFASKTKGKSIKELIKEDTNFVYFASMQDLRGSDIVGGNFNKNDDIYQINWDFVVVDEAHEGTKTTLGKNVLEKIIKNTNQHTTYVLELSGTPFNLLTDFEKESIYTWDYIMEQEAKANWDVEHLGDSNPYAELPRMNIFTYHLEKSLPVYIDVEDKAFNFKEFFRIWTGDINKDLKPKPNNVKIGDFVHENDINAFLDLICKKDDSTNYPFSTEEFRDFFRHSLWVVPGVKEAKALSSLLNKHHVFSHFTIVNVAGDGDEEIDTSNALLAVKNAMTNHPENTYTITLSCGRLTTGVSVPEWTCVLMLAGTYSTAASQYLQTIFRVQTPANINGKMKEECFVFDFAPDRTLKMVAESVQLSAKAGASNSAAEITLAKFLNYCPVIAIDDSNMKEYKVAQLLQELKKAYAERVARNGFDDPKIYNDELLKLTEIELREFENLKKIVGSSKQAKKQGEIDINSEGFNEEEFEEKKTLEKKKKSELTEEEKQRLAELKEKKRNRDSAISILRAISIRMPLMVYGMNKDIAEDITIDNFAENIDDSSWVEFMPKGVTKEIFKQFSKYYDKDIFVAASRRIRYIAKSADELEPTERVKRLAELFSTFKNPDKETVLTPWRVVNLHLSNTIGGYDFYDVNHENMLDDPRFVEHEDVTSRIFNKDSKILEINSKSGLYPLYMVYSLYREHTKDSNLSFEKKLEIWDEVIKNQMFVICKTPMSKLITQRTLLGYRNGKTNMHSFDDLIMQLKDKPNKFVDKVKSKSFWNIGGNGEMKFNAIVGNPPYQIMDGGAKASAMPVYNYFVTASKAINPNFISLIMPARWMTGGKGLDNFRDDMINDKSIAVLHDYYNGKEIFNNVEIKGGVCYFLWIKNYNNKCHIETHMEDKVLHSFRFLKQGTEDVFIRDERLISILNKVIGYDSGFFSQIVSPLKPYGLRGDVFKDPQKYSLPQFSDEPIKDGLTIYGLDDHLKRIKKYAPKDYPLPKTDLVANYKIFVARNQGSGIFGETLSNPIMAKNNEICTETYVVFGPFAQESQMKNCWSYVQTKFFRALMGIKKRDQNASASVYSYIPLVDFNEEWTDSKLYLKFNLSDSEIDFIETSVKEMK